MRSPVVAFALAIAVACSGYAFAADQSPQPLTRADCKKAGMKWNDRANVCGSNAAAPAPAKNYHHRTPEWLTAIGTIAAVALALAVALFGSWLGQLFSIPS
jgi:hypothetical protein